MKILLNSKNSKLSSNVDEKVTLEFESNIDSIPVDVANSLVDQYEQYVVEKDRSNKYRFIFTINPVCSNVLFNSISEIVSNEGGNECVLFDNSTGHTINNSGFNNYNYFKWGEIMKTGLVFSGGGARGAYEVGVWKALEELSSKIFHPISGTSMDELFTRYMYYERACLKNKSTTTEALRKFYEKGSYALLKKDKTLSDLEALADFWNDVSNQDKERFSEDVLRRLYVLNYAPNGMWYYFTSVYFMHNKDADGNLDDIKFCAFLTKITAFIWAYAITNPGVNLLRTPVYAEMVNIIEGNEVEFAGYKFEATTLKSMFNNYYFSNARPITRSMLTWWIFNDAKQPLLSLESVFEIEHIFAKKRQEIENALSDAKQLESLGNKSLLEKKINIRVSDFRFGDKKKYYVGFTNSKGQQKEGTKIIELHSIATKMEDFASCGYIY